MLIKWRYEIYLAIIHIILFSVKKQKTKQNSTYSYINDFYWNYNHNKLYVKIFKKNSRCKCFIHTLSKLLIVVNLVTRIIQFIFN